MDYLQLLLPKIEHLGRWSYLFLLLISILESSAGIGLLVPGTTVTVFAGFLAAQYILDLGDVIWIVALGGIIGDGLSYYLGKRGINWFGENHRFFKLAYLKKGEEFFNRHGNKSVLLARFLGPIRPIVPFVAGISKMPAKKFFFLNIISAFVCAAIYALAGFFFGQIWSVVQTWVHRVEGGLILVAAVLFVGYWLRKKYFNEKKL